MTEEHAPIQHLRERLAKASLPPNDATAELIRALPALLAVADAMRELARHDLGYPADRIVASALAKLDEVTPNPSEGDAK